MIKEKGNWGSKRDDKTLQNENRNKTKPHEGGRKKLKSEMMRDARASEWKIPNNPPNH